MRGLDAKVVLITGAARGMGAATARRLVDEGADVLLTDVLHDDGKALADELGDRARYRPLDVTDEDGWADVVAAAERELGRLDGLVNNAGILGFGKLIELDLASYDRVVRVNQVGVFLGMKHAVPAMQRAGGGSIVNVSSVEGLGAAPLLTAYTATKFAVRGMTKAAALELGHEHIRVNSIHPGAIRTPMVLDLGGGDEAGLDFIASKTALARMGDPEEVAACTAFLLSDDASYVTGAELSIDGGVTASSGFTG